jgi:hypothetical protein
MNRTASRQDGRRGTAVLGAQLAQCRDVAARLAPLRGAVVPGAPNRGWLDHGAVHTGTVDRATVGSATADAVNGSWWTARKLPTCPYPAASLSGGQSATVAVNSWGVACGNPQAARGSS